jgi:hypothetical protein
MKMRYFICRKCGGYYELKKDEAPEDFEKCECGGTLEYYVKDDTEDED